MAFKIIDPVYDEPVSKAEARLQCKVDDDDTSQDALLLAYITAAREYAEHYTGRALAPQTLEQALDEFPADSIALDLSPVTEIVSIKYTDTAGDEQTIDPADYVLNDYGSAHSVSPAYGVTWPATRAIPNAVRIQYIAGYDEIPQAVKSAILIDVQIRFDKLTPADADNARRARDSLLDTVKVYG